MRRSVGPTKSPQGSILVLALFAVSALACKGDAKKKDDSIVAAANDTAALAVDSPPGADDEALQEHLESEEYRFRLTSPGPGWSLQSRQEIQKITPDAQAGLRHRKGLIGVVIVERATGMELDAMADLIIDGMALENKVVTARENIEFVGLPAVDYEVQGSISDIPMDYRGRIFMRDGYAYQIVTFAARGMPVEEDVASIFANFSLSDGKIEAQGAPIEHVDTTGIGWRLQGGVFESAVTGLRVKPTGNWRAAVGAEARRINVDAEVVMVSSSPEAYFLVLPERIGDARPEVYRQDRLDNTIATMKGTVTRESYEGEIVGQPATMTRLSSDEFPWTFQVGVGFAKGWAIQATGWYSTSFGDEGEAALGEALASVTRMSDAEVASLRKELLALPDQQNHVGADHSLRAGVFEDYKNAVRWTKPAGFWEVSSGHAARDINPVAQLYGRYQNSAAHMLLVAEPLAPNMSALDYHNASFGGASNNLNLRAKHRAKTSRIGSGPALLSDATTSTAGIELYYRVVTAVRGTRAVQLHLWGPAAGIPQHREALAKVASNLELLEELPATRRQGATFADQRLGYSMELPVQYRYLDATPAEIGGIGSFATWGVDGQDWVGLLALCMIEEGQDLDWSLNFMEERIQDSYSELIHELRAERSDTQLFGLPARHLVWKSLTLRLDAYIFRQNKTIYALLATDKDRGTKMRERAVAGFKFLTN